MEKKEIMEMKIPAKENITNFKNNINCLLKSGYAKSEIAGFLNMEEKELDNYCRCTAANNIIWLKLTCLIATKQLEKSHA